ncbi:MAG: DNA/RNA non-specific endonuclease, partial [Paeniglutamicibacter terrestris]
MSLSKARRFARWAAWNIDGADIKLLSRADINFTKDPRLVAESQVGNELYSGNRLDRSHIARRADLLWGDLPEAQQANRNSFYYGNITPQMDDFNQSSQNGIWGRLENALYEDLDVEDLRVSVFSGPVFHPDDRVYRGIALPSEYWKLLVFQNQGVLKLRAFWLTQDLDRMRTLWPWMSLGSTKSPWMSLSIAHNSISPDRETSRRTDRSAGNSRKAATGFLDRHCMVNGTRSDPLPHFGRASLPIFGVNGPFGAKGTFCTVEGIGIAGMATRWPVKCSGSSPLPRLA